MDAMSREWTWWTTAALLSEFAGSTETSGKAKVKQKAWKCVKPTTKDTVTEGS